MSAIDPEFCPTCGTALVSRQFDGRERGYCSNCEEYIFHLPAPSAGVVVIDGDEILLVHRIGRHWGGTWGFPGGLVEWDEEPHRAAARELSEETGLEANPNDLTLETASRLPGPRGKISNTHLTYAISSGETSGTLSPGEDVQDACFWTLDDMDQSDEDLRPGVRPQIHEVIDGESRSR